MAARGVRIYIEADASGVVKGVGVTRAALGSLSGAARGASTRMAALNAITEQQRRNYQALSRTVRYGAGILGGAAVGGVGLLVKKGIELNATWEKATTAISTFTGSARTAARFMEKLRTVSNQSPLRLTEYQRAAQLLLGFGVSAEKVIPLLDAVNKAIVATGGGSEELYRTVRALGQMQGRGKAAAQELLQLSEVGVPVNKILQKQLGLTGEQVSNIGEEGVKASTALEAIRKGWEQQYGAAYRNAKDTFNFQISSLGKDFEHILRVSTEPLFDSIKSAWLPAITRATEQVGKIWDSNVGSTGDKVRRSFEVIRRQLAPLIRGVGREIDELDLPARFGQALSDAIPVVAKHAGQLAIKASGAFVEGFLASDAWGKLAMGGWLATRIFGTGAVFRGIAGQISRALAPTFQRASMSTAGTALGLGLMSAAKYALPGIVAGVGLIDGIADLLQRDAESRRSGLFKVGGSIAGALVGGIAGSFVGNPVIGALFGSGLGSAVGGLVGDATKGMGGVADAQKRLAASGRQMQHSFEQMKRASRSVRAAARNVREARKGERQSARQVHRAEQQLADARKRYPANSEPVRRAEIRLTRARDRQRTATRKLRQAERLQGQERKASRIVLKQTVITTKDRISQLAEERKRVWRQFQAAKQANKPIAEQNRLGEQYLKLSGQWRSARAKLNRSYAEAARTIGPKFSRHLKNATTDEMRMGRAASNAADLIDPMWQKTIPGVNRGLDRLGVESRGARRKVKDAFGVMRQSMWDFDGTSYNAIGNVLHNANTGLGSFGADPLPTNLRKPKRKQRGGHINMGTPTGDSVHALLERDEYVLNRNAVEYLGGPKALDIINFKLASRFRTGGVVPAVSKAIRAVQSRFPGVAVTSTTGGGHAANSYHYRGMAVDLAASAEVMRRASEWIKRAMGSQLLEGIHNPNLSIKNGRHVPPSFWGSATWANHANHIHLALGALGAIAGGGTSIPRPIWTGPDSYLKDSGQKVSDRVRKVGLAFLRRSAPTTGVEVGAGGGGGILSRQQLRKLMRSVGLPSIFGWIAEAESGRNPNARNSSGASGLWQIMMPLHSALVQRAGGNVFNPLTNARVAKMLYQQSGLAPWAPSRSGWGPHMGQPYRRGGLIPFGGAFASGGIVPGPLGAPRMILAHGHEAVIPPVQRQRGGGLAASLDPIIRIPKALERIFGGRSRIGKLPFRDRMTWLQYLLTIAEQRGRPTGDIQGQMLDVLTGRKGRVRRLIRRTERQARRPLSGRERRRIQQRTDRGVQREANKRYRRALRQARRDDERVSQEQRKRLRREAEQDAERRRKRLRRQATADVREARRDRLGERRSKLIDELGSLQSEISGLREDMTQSLSENLQAQNDLLQQQLAELRDAKRLADTEYGVLARAITAVVSGSIGGRVGLGSQTPAVAGSLASY